MSDDTQPPESPKSPENLPPSPEQFQFPIQLLEQWVAIPPGERINTSLTRQDFDHLLFGLLRANEATALLQRGMVSWSHGNMAEANEFIAQFQRLNAYSQNNFRQFFTALMVAALQGRKNV